MRTTADRIRHAILFEVIGILLLLPLGTFVLGLSTEQTGVIGVGSAIVATLWNYVYNLGFDHLKLRWTGTTAKTVRVRVLHALLFEGGLLVLLLPPMAWYLGITLWDALILDIAIVIFYLVYAFVYNLCYDRIFPVPPTQQTPAG